MGEIGGDQEVSASAAHEERILVSVRLRPLNEKEIGRNDVSDWECVSDNTVVFRSNLPEKSMFPTAYSFDKVFRHDCNTRRVYEEAAKEVALSVVSGINSSIFAYGQTSSGKTYTMTGVTEYALADICDYIQRHVEREFILKFSAMEIYNEAVRDLLSSDTAPLRLLDDPERGTVVDKLTEETLRDWSHVQELLSACEAQRQIGETSLNETSSRSHQILRLTIQSSPREFLGRHNSSTLVASVDFVDLAGSERASQALSAGARLKEGCHINRSLLTLGTVVRKLSKGRNGHVPYRDSKLTRILQCSLGGNARTAIICTISPARTHVEQSRNTLLFASCAKQVATNAQVNVVMSDKVLVKQLQKELARLENELKAPAPKSSTPVAAAILREKDLQIEKMQKEIQELIHQRDLAQSRLRDLAQVVEDDRASKFSAEHQCPKSPALHAWEDDQSISASSSIADQNCIDASFTSYNNATWYSNARSESSSDEQYQQLPESQDDHYLSDGVSPRQSISSSKFVGPDQGQVFEDIREDKEEDEEKEEQEELCKEVRCIEIEESRTNSKIVSSDLSNEEHEEGGQLEPLAVTENEWAKDQELVSTPKKGDEELAQADSVVTYSALEQKLQDVQKSIDCLVNPVSSDESASPWTSAAGSSCGRKSFQLTRSRSCKATIMNGSSSPWFQAEQYERPLYTYEKCYTGTPEVFQTNYSPSNFGADIKKLTRENSQASERSASTDDLKPPNVKTSDKEDITSIQTFVADLKEMAKLEYEKQLIGDQAKEEEVKAYESVKSVKDVGIDPIQESPESPSKWPLEFERKQREIIELWHFCCISLVHRTYFFLLFKGDSSDSIYLEVELRRLSFLKDNFSRGNFHKVSSGADQDLSLASSKKALRREREMLSKQLAKRFSEEERANLYREWGIGLDTKQRRVQLARLLWSDTKDMNHIKESATLVAKLVGLFEPGQALKEMCGLSFTPRHPSQQRSYSWRRMSSLI
ncbi:kinesin-like protein KIN-7E [Papaver somniferum]|uniref:kinesin-like protein KIN-7E n=1 Tax=Papaver somniferum TaxID=3469 RepID=UPI000E704135|nr:kinesin-like protein KIN-7E [Papaver somniferum]